MEKSDCKKDAADIATREEKLLRINKNHFSDGRPKCRITPGRQRIDWAVAPASVPLTSREFSKMV